MGTKSVSFFAFLGDDDGAVGEELEGAAGGGFIDAADLGNGGDGDGFGGVAEGGDDALFLGGEAGEEVAEDELEGIIALRATAQVGEGVGDGGAVAAADLPGGPGEEQGVAAGLVDEAKAVGLGGGGEGGVVAGDVGEGLEGGGLVELLEFEPSAGGDDKGAAGEEGFAGAREVTEQGEEAALVGVGEGFEVVEDEKGAGAGEGVDEEARALVGGGLGDLGLLESADDGVEHLGEAADGEWAFVVRAMRIHGGLLGGEEDDVVEVSGRGQLGGADGEGGLAHAARAINERAPAGGVGMEVWEELGELGVATEEALDGGEVGAGS